MPTQCSADLFGFAPVEGRRVVAGFDGGRMTSDAGALLLGATDRAIGLVDRFAECFADSRAPELIEHTVRTLVGQRVFALALGYEDLVDHDELRHDPTMAVLGRQAVGAAPGLCAAGRSALACVSKGCPLAGRRHDRPGRPITQPGRLLVQFGRAPVSKRQTYQSASCQCRVERLNMTSFLVVS